MKPWLNKNQSARFFIILNSSKFDAKPIPVGTRN